MTIAEKKLRAKEDYDAVHEAGKAEGKQEGYTEAEAITIGLIERTLTELVIPDGVKIIGLNAFFNIYPLKKITIPEGVEIIQGSAFGWSALTELTLPLSCHTLEANALAGVWYAKTIKLGNVKSIGSKAFSQCNALTELDFSRCDSVPTLASVDALDENSLKNNPKILVPAALYYDWIEATNWAEYADYIVPDGPVPSKGLLIENGELKGRGTCTDSVIVVPNEVKTIAMNSFVEDATLDTLILHEGGVTIDDYSVYGSTLRVVENFYNSAGLALASCPLERVTFLPSCDRLQLEAINLDNDTTYDFSRHTEVPQLEAWNDYYEVSAGTKFIVPASLYEEWINATNWTLVRPYIVPAEN
jgi:hypothetical protein